MKRLVLFALFILNISALSAQIVTPITQTTTPLDNNDNTIRPTTTKSAPDKATDTKPAMLSTNDIASNIAHMKTLASFYNAVQIAGLTETFKSKGPITIFVPDDQAFAKLPPGKLDTLLKPAHKYDLIALITNHAIAGKLTRGNIVKQINSGKKVAIFTTLAGSKLTGKIDAGGNIILTDENGGQSTITQVNIPQSNGMLFVINAVLIPKNKL